MYLDEFINHIKSYDLRLKNSIRGIGYEVSNSILDDLKLHSPVDTGEYRSRWQMLRLNAGRKSYFSMSFVNRTPHSYWMEFGGIEKGAPWNFPSAKNSSNISKSGKLKVLRGRVWAGGLNPGHDMSVGGAFYPSIIKNTKRLDKLANDIADVMVRNF